MSRQSLPGLLYIQGHRGHPQPSLPQPTWVLVGPTIVWGLLVNIILQASVLKGYPPLAVSGYLQPTATTLPYRQAPIPIQQ